MSKSVKKKNQKKNRPVGEGTTSGRRRHCWWWAEALEATTLLGGGQCCLVKEGRGKELGPTICRRTKGWLIWREEGGGREAATFTGGGRSCTTGRKERYGRVELKILGEGFEIR
jgi:hypothetical protein